MTNESGSGGSFTLGKMPLGQQRTCARNRTALNVYDETSHAVVLEKFDLYKTLTLCPFL
jgi:hypothetical protein